MGRVAEINFSLCRHIQIWMWLNTCDCRFCPLASVKNLIVKMFNPLVIRWTLCCSYNNKKYREKEKNHLISAIVVLESGFEITLMTEFVVSVTFICFCYHFEENETANGNWFRKAFGRGSHQVDSTAQAVTPTNVGQLATAFLCGFYNCWHLSRNGLNQC